MSQDDDKTKSPDNSVVVNMTPNFENKNKVNKSNPDETPTNDGNNLVDIEKNQFKVRNDLVARATDFILSNIKNISMDRKIDFLQKKGLTNTEIELAIQIAKAQNNQNQYALLPQQPVCLNTPNAIQTPLKPQNWLFRHLVGPVTCVVLGLYFGYHVYKNYVQKWLFGVQKSPLEKRLEEVEALVHRCLLLLEGQNKMSEISDAKANHQIHLEQIHAEVKSVKGLLVNKSQFPPAPKTSKMPNWQNTKSDKPQVHQQNNVTVNGNSTPNKSRLNTLNEQNSSSLVVHSSSSPFAVVGSHTTGVVHGDIVDKNSVSTDDSKSNGFVSPMSFDDNAITSEVIVINDDENE